MRQLTMALGLALIVCAGPALADGPPAAPVSTTGAFHGEVAADDGTVIGLLDVTLVEGFVVHAAYTPTTGGPMALSPVGVPNAPMLGLRGRAGGDSLMFHGRSEVGGRFTGTVRGTSGRKKVSAAWTIRRR